jgi:hypothetical protein
MLVVVLMYYVLVLKEMLSAVMSISSMNMFFILKNIVKVEDI